MIRFDCDYSEGCIPKILERLRDTNFEQNPGYSMDPHCERARRLIREFCDAPKADVHFLVGGTQTNMTLIAAALRPHQGVLAASTGHVNVHESGAIEATGHKVLPLPSLDGKVTADQVREALDAHFHDPHAEHTVQPRLLYISQPTENGTIYSLKELTVLSAVCREYGVWFYNDGARLGYALAAPENDATAADLARLADAFYIGGTKVGALFGEALVLTAPGLKQDFRYLLKQRGGMLAKGRLLGIQFECLMEDGEYLAISRHAVEQARRMKASFLQKGWPLLYDSPTNQQFPIIDRHTMELLGEKYSFDIWADLGDGRTAVRFCASWATKPEDVDALLSDIQTLPEGGTPHC